MGDKKKIKKPDRIIISIFIFSFFIDILGIRLELSFSNILHILFAFVCFITTGYYFFKIKK